MMAGVIRGTRDPEMFTRLGHLVAQVGNLCGFTAPMKAQVDNLCYGGGKKVPATKSGYAADLKRLQDELLRARIDRARQLTEDQRLSKAFDLTNSALVRMHEGAMAELDAADPAIGWREVRRRLERLRRARVRNVVPPVGPPANSRSIPNDRGTACRSCCRWEIPGEKAIVPRGSSKLAWLGS